MSILKESEKKSLLRSIRINPSLDKRLELIAAYEDRTVSTTILRFLKQAVDKYFKNNSMELSAFCNEHGLVIT